VKVVGMRLKSAREGRGLSLREFARELKEDFTLLARIEQGERFPPKRGLKKFAKAVSLTPQQLEALIAVERRGLNPYELLPEIPPAHISDDSIEQEAEKVLNKYRRAVNQVDIELPIPIEKVIGEACRLSTKRCDFAKERIPSRHSGALYGGLYPDGLEGKDKLVVVNTGRIDGGQLSSAEQRITVAHEAGHYVLHCGNKESAQLFFRFTKEPTFCREAECNQTPFNSLEYQASAFAACLLLPRKQFVREWQKASWPRPNLAKIFDVTDAIVRLRARMLGFAETKT
jgi:transcriptional regulator with XRE-family HTH domain